MVQRDLAAYTREHLDVTATMPQAPPILHTTTADAPAIEAALRALITSGDIGHRTVRHLRHFWSNGATHAQITAALRTARFARADEMATHLLDGHRVTLYSDRQLSYIPGIIWDTTISDTHDNLDVQTRRGLTQTERAAATSVYGGSLAYDDIVLEDAPIMGIGGYARTTPWQINFPTGTLSGGGPGLRWLIHELGHSWQYARGVSLATTLYHAVRGVYDYGGEPALIRNTAAGNGLSAFNTEQQADIAADAYDVLSSGGAAAAYQPYLTEFRSGTYR